MKVWDLHCDTLYELRRAEKAGAPKSFLHNDLHIDLEKLQQGDYLLQCFAAYVDLADPAPGADPLVSVLEEIEPVSARLIANKAHYKFKGEEIEALRRRLEQAVNA